MSLRPSPNRWPSINSGVTVASRAQSANVGIVEPSLIEELRLTAFKSFRDATVCLSELTLLIGRNGSGKSNLLDALEVLRR